MESLKQHEEVQLPTPECDMERNEGDVVLHYKREMDDNEFLPLYAEGVKWLVEEPTEPPLIAEHNKSWKATTVKANGSEGKSPFESLRDDIRYMMGLRVRNR